MSGSLMCPRSQLRPGAEQTPSRGGTEDKACFLLRKLSSLRICTQARQDTEGKEASRVGMQWTGGLSGSLSAPEDDVLTCKAGWVGFMWVGPAGGQA